MHSTQEHFVGMADFVRCTIDRGAPNFSFAIAAIDPRNVSRHFCAIKGRIEDKPDNHFWKNEKGTGKLVPRA